jgi:hypothetical protein
MLPLMCSHLVSGGDQPSGDGMGAGWALCMRSGVQYSVVGEGWIWLPVDPVSRGAGAGVEAVADRTAAIPATAATAMAITASFRVLERLTVVYSYLGFMAPSDQSKPLVPTGP